MRMLLALGVLAMSTMSVIACMSDDRRQPPQDRTSGGCMISGCADEVCADQAMASPCIWKDSFACYADATCDRQTDGVCGWTTTSALTTCLAAAHD